MDERLHSMFRREMSSQVKPSLDGMAAEVLSKGRRARRARTVKIASAALVVAGLVGGAVAVPTIMPGHTTAHQVANALPPVLPSAKPGPGASPAPADILADKLLTSGSSSGDYIPQPPGPKAKTTGAAVLDELLKLLPPGATSNYALYDDKIQPGQWQIGAQAYLAGAHGLGMVRIFLFNDSMNTKACTSFAVPGATQTCSTLPSGALLAVSTLGNCIEKDSVIVDHGHDTVVQVQLSTCLAWNGTANPPSPLAINQAQAERIAENPAWGAQQMDASLVRDAARRFAGVPAGH